MAFVELTLKLSCFYSFYWRNALHREASALSEIEFTPNPK
jgi:hypothetical protein